MGREDFTGGVIGREHRQPYLGRGLFAGGIVLILVAVTLTASASVAEAVGLSGVGARELAGGLAGIGLAGTLVGAIATVPTDRGTWYRGIGGALIALCGVAAFLWAYPGRWYGDSPDLTFSVVAVYFLGVVTLASYLFAGVSDLARRVGRGEALAAAVPGGDALETTGDEANGTEKEGTDPSEGEVLYERTDDTGAADAGNGATAGAMDAPALDRIEPAEGEFAWPDSGFSIESVDPAGSADRAPTGAERPSAAGWSNGGTDDVGSSGNGETRERSGEHDGGRSAPIALASNGAGTITAPASDARSAETDPSTSTDAGTATDTNGADATPAATERTDSSASAAEGPAIDDGNAAADGGVDAIGFGPSVDRYCGNCGHFRYVRTEKGLSPYCGYHDEVMDDMEPCLGWTSNA